MPATPSRAEPRAPAAPADEAKRPANGSLRDRLIAVTHDLIANEGTPSLTLRRIARRAGVSHGAPLRHFASLSDLLADVAADGFQLLEAAIDDAARAGPDGDDALDRLRAAGRGYVNAAVENPGLFTLMFQPDRLARDNPRYVAHSHAAFERLVRLVRAAQDIGWQTGRDTRLLAGVVWSGVHGLASLWSQSAFQGPVPDASLADALDLAGEMLFTPSDRAADATDANRAPHSNRTPMPVGHDGGST